MFLKIHKTFKDIFFMGTLDNCLFSTIMKMSIICLQANIGSAVAQW